MSNMHKTTLSIGRRELPLLLIYMIMPDKDDAQRTAVTRVITTTATRGYKTRCLSYWSSDATVCSKQVHMNANSDLSKRLNICKTLSLTHPAIFAPRSALVD